MRRTRCMLTTTVRASVLTLGLTGAAMAQEQILISSDWGNVKAELVDNEATRSLVRMLPVTIEMRDHLRQEKTGDLPSPLAPVPRQTAFLQGHAGAVERGPFRDLLPRWPRAPAGHHHPWASDGGCLDFRQAGRGHGPRRAGAEMSASRAQTHTCYDALFCVISGALTDETDS